MAKILYLGFFQLPDKDAAAIRVLNNAKAFRLAGHEVVLIDEQKGIMGKDILSNKKIVAGFTTYSMIRPDSLFGYFKKMITVKGVMDVIEAYNYSFDLVIAYNFPSIALNILRKRLSGKVKIAADCTEWYSGREYLFPKNVFAYLDSEYRMRIVQKRLNGLICISSFLAKYYQNVSSIVQVPPLVDIEEKVWNQEQFMYDNKSLNLCYVGNPVRGKELFTPIVDLIESMPEQSIVFRIAGITQDEYENVERREHKTARYKNTYFLGSLSHNECVKLIKSSDAFVFIRENSKKNMAGFSTKFVEASTAGTYIITNPTGDIPLYINSTCPGQLVNNTNELRDAIECLISTKEIKENRTNNVFDYREYSSRLNDWINSLLGTTCES